MKRSNTQGNLLTGARQTMLSWIKVIKSFDDLPEAYKSTVLELLTDGQGFPYAVFAPPVSGSRFYPTEKLVLWVDETLYILTQQTDQIDITGYSNQAISHLETGSILLYSWFTVSGITIEGESKESTVAYNTATHRHIQPFLNRIRSFPVNSARLQAEQIEFDYLAPLNFKFFNFARNSLKGNEKVITSLWQPAISHSVFPLFKQAFKRLITPAHLTILTDQEIIFIEDDTRSIDTKGKRYGGIWRYIPLGNILSMSVIERNDGLLSFLFKLKADISIERIFGADLQSQVMQLKTELENNVEA